MNFERSPVVNDTVLFGGHGNYAHLGVLAQQFVANARSNAGLIERSTEAQWRRCSLRGEGFRAAADWIEFYRKFWEESFDRLDAFLRRTAPPPVAPKAKSKSKKGGRRG